MKLRCRIVVILAVCAASVATAVAFTMVGKDAAPRTLPPFVHWDCREFPDCIVPYAINRDGTADFIGEHAEIDKAFRVWEAVAPAIIRFRNVGNTAKKTSAQDGENVLFWDNNLTNGDPWDAVLLGGAIAATTIFQDAVTGVIEEVDIVFDDAHFDWNAGVQRFRFPPVGDDVRVGMNIRNRDNDVCDTRAVGDDVQVIRVGGAAAPGDVCVAPGPNAVLESLPNLGGRVDVWAVAAHEIGHFLGLGENNAVGAGSETAETANDEPFNLPFGGGTLTFTVNGRPVAVDLPPGQLTAAQVAAAIQNAINNQAAGLAMATARAGSVRIQAVNPNHDVIITGGDAADVLGLTVGESGISTMNQIDPRKFTTLDQRTLSRDDMDGVNFLYTPDLGDAPDPFAGFNHYPSLVHGPTARGRLNGVQLFAPAAGAEHLFGLFGRGVAPRYQYEWLGREGGRIDDHELECEARVPNRDAFDDGVSFGGPFFGNFEPGGDPIPVTVHVQTAADIAGGAHVYDTANSMYINGWFDWNADGDWDDAGEHVIGAAAGQFSVLVPGPYMFNVAAPAGARPGGFSRFRLDYREDVGQVRAVDPTLMLTRGAAQFGEVEDYPIGIVRTIVQLHIIGPTPNKVPIGMSGTIAATVQSRFDGVPGANVTFTKLRGNVRFTAGTVAADGKSTDGKNRGERVGHDDSCFGWGRASSHQSHRRGDDTVRLCLLLRSMTERLLEGARPRRAGAKGT